MRFAAILLSRQAARPTRTTPWVRRTTEAVHWIREQRYGLASSVGMLTWDLATCLAVEQGLPLKLFVPMKMSDSAAGLCDALAVDFGLDLSRTEFVPVTVERKPAKHTMMAARDQAVIEQSDLLLPLSLRKGSSLARIIGESGDDGRRIDRRFEIPYDQASHPLKITYQDNVSWRPTKQTWLIHWTRGVSHKWPGERTLDFCGAILNSDRWRRTAFDTLQRMVDSGVILASGRHMPRRWPTVSFSSLSPPEALPLMRWRPRYGEMSFEPYGIGVRADAAEVAGIRPVIYLHPGENHSDYGDDYWLTQSSGVRTDWRQEREYRCDGDFSLRRIPRDSVRLFCATESEADMLRLRFPYQINSLFAS